MSEMGTQLFDAVVGELPPSTVDVDDIVRAEKRRSAVRTTGIASAAVALSITAGLGLTMGGGPGASSPPPATQAAPPGSATSPTRDTRFALVADSPESAAATAKRLRAALGYAIKKEAPGATWLAGAPPKIFFKTTEPAGVDIFTGSDTLAYRGRKGTVWLGISIARPVADGPDAGQVFDPFACPADATCVPGKAPNGARTLVMTSRDGTVDARVGLSGKRWLDVSAASVLTAEQVLAAATNLASQIKS